MSGTCGSRVEKAGTCMSESTPKVSRTETILSGARSSNGSSIWVSKAMMVFFRQTWDFGLGRPGLSGISRD